MWPVPSPYRQLNDPDWLRTEYIGRGRTAADIASEIGCPHKTVDRALRRHGIRRPPHRTLADWLHEQYVARRRSITDIAAEVGSSRTSVRRALVEAGIPVDDLRLPPELNDPEWLAAQDGVGSRELAPVASVSPPTPCPEHGSATASSQGPGGPRRTRSSTTVPGWRTGTAAAG